MILHVSARNILKNQPIMNFRIALDDIESIDFNAKKAPDFLVRGF